MGRDSRALLPLVHAAAAEVVADKAITSSGIESWGATLLKGNGAKWESVKGGLGGAVEVAVVRNAIAHGSRTVSESAAERLRKAGAKPERKAGDRISLSYQHLRGWRNRLESLMTASGLG